MSINRHMKAEEIIYKLTKTKETRKYYYKTRRKYSAVQ